MKWITPALVLAMVPAGIGYGQSSSSDFGSLATGPVAEVLPGSGSRSFRPGVVNPNDFPPPPATNPPTANPLPGDPNPLPTATRSRGSLINEPVPYSQVPQIQQNIYSLEDTFTLPRTPAVSPKYTQQQPVQTTAPVVDTTYPTQMRSSVISQPIQPDMATAPAAVGVCACGSNELAPDDCQCSSCTGQFSQTEFSSDCSSCNQIVQDGFDEFSSCDTCNSCDSFEMVSSDCGCDSCDSFEMIETDCGCGICNGMSDASCEVVGASQSYFQTEQRGFANDVADRDIKLGCFTKHFNRLTGRKQSLNGNIGGVGGVGGIGGVGGAAAIGGVAAIGQGNGGNNVYQPAVANTRNPNDTQTNTLFNISGVFLNRNTPNLPLSFDRVPAGATPTRFLNSGDADFDEIGGFDASLVRRRASGKGIELRYLALNPGTETSSLNGSPLTVVTDFGQIGQIGGLTHQQAFNLASVHEVSRDMSVQNAEFNLLRMGRQAQTRRGREAIFEYLLGFRYFKFEETLSYSAFGVRPNIFAGGDISRADYVSDVENELYGAQFGGRSEFSLSKRVSLLAGLKAGIFQNNVRSSVKASVTDFNGNERIAHVLNDPNQGTPFNFSGDDEDYTLLGELDLGLAYRVTNSIRVRGGYKAIYVDDIAFADNQGSSDFSNIAANSTPNTNDDLVLYGGYFGLDFAF